MKMKTRKGFTLTELLIVMAIVVVLAAVAVPTFGRQLETSRETADLEVIRNAYTEALSIAVLDAADGTINGVIGDAGATEPAKGSEAAKWDKVSYVKQEGTIAAHYQVKVSFSQSKPKGFEDADQEDTAKRAASWKYVSSEFMNCSLPIVYADMNALNFTFKISDTEPKKGSVILAETKYKAAVQEQGTSDTPGYVAAQAEVPAVFSIGVEKVNG